jgi:hypothetical protein
MAMQFDDTLAWPHQFSPQESATYVRVMTTLRTLPSRHRLPSPENNPTHTVWCCEMQADSPPTGRPLTTGPGPTFSLNVNALRAAAYRAIVQPKSKLAQCCVYLNTVSLLGHLDATLTKGFYTVPPCSCPPLWPSGYSTRKKENPAITIPSGACGSTCIHVVHVHVLWYTYCTARLRDYPCTPTPLNDVFQKYSGTANSNDASLRPAVLEKDQPGMHTHTKLTYCQTAGELIDTIPCCSGSHTGKI